MRSFSYCLALSLLSTPALCQSWEKLISPGLSYRMEVQQRVPLTWHMLKWSRGAPDIFGRSEVSQMKIFANAGAAARQPMSELQKQAGAIASINGDFFGASGEPLGAVVRDSVLLSRPFPNRVVFGWGKETQAVAMLNWKGTVGLPDGSSVVLNGLNEDVPATQGMVLFTDSAGEARVPDGAMAYILKADRSGLSVFGTLNGIVDSIDSSSRRIAISERMAVVVVGSERKGELANLKVGDSLSVKSEVSGLNWEKIDQVVGGGPMLIRNGEIRIDWERAGFSASFTNSRHPRTAIGYTKEGDIYAVTVDGRQPGISIGVSLQQLAEAMFNLGCVEAINLDGGGSTTLTLFGEIMNRPSDGRERPVSNGVLFFGPKQEQRSGPVVIQGPAQVKPGSFSMYKLIGPDGVEIPTREVFWSAMGPGGWMDQSGGARALNDGSFVIRGHSKGQVASLTVSVGP